MDIHWSAQDDQAIKRFRIGQFRSLVEPAQGQPVPSATDPGVDMAEPLEGDMLQDMKARRAQLRKGWWGDRHSAGKRQEWSAGKEKERVVWAFDAPGRRRPGADKNARTLPACTGSRAMIRCGTGAGQAAGGSAGGVSPSTGMPRARRSLRSISAIISGCSLRNFLAFSRPWPMRSSW